MTVFLWVVVIVMAVSLLAEILAFIGMALVARRAARRAKEITEQILQRVNPSIDLVKETRLSLQPLVQSVVADGGQIRLLLSARLQSLQVAAADAARRSQRIRLRLSQGVQTVEQQQRAQRGSYREVAESVHNARKVLRGLSLALWFLRKVA